MLYGLIAYSHIAALSAGLIAAFLFQDRTKWAKPLISYPLAIFFVMLVAALWPFWLIAELIEGRKK